jgi:hypothetical protein
MPRLLASAVFAAALAVCACASAQVYKWKDANGTTHYSDVPPPAGSKYDRVSVSGNVATPVAAAPAPASSITAAGKAAAGAQSGRNAASTPDTPDNRAKFCKQLDGNIALLNSDQPVTAGDADTPQRDMSDVQRRQELATAQAQKKQYCQ